MHRKYGVEDDLPAAAAPLDGPTRRRVTTAVLDLQNRPGTAARVSRRQDLDEWLTGSPPVEVALDEEQLRTAPRRGSGWGSGMEDEHLNVPSREISNSTFPDTDPVEGLGGCRVNPLPLVER